jgi:hypothetical protein
MKPLPHGSTGNRNALKPPGERRVKLEVRVRPETLRIIAALAVQCGSRGRAVDELAQKTRPVS